MPVADNVPIALLKEAADWAIVFQYDNPTEAQHAAFDRWRQQSPVHAMAWAHAENVFHTFDQAAGEAGKDALRQLESGHGRRHNLRLLALLLVSAPVGWLALRQVPWSQWAADTRTAAGERKTLTLPDGSQVVLNTASAVNVMFSDAERRVYLAAGEILVTTHRFLGRRATFPGRYTKRGGARSVHVSASANWMQMHSR